MVYEDHGYRVHVANMWTMWDQLGVYLIKRRVINGAAQTLYAEHVDFTWRGIEEGVELVDRPSLILPHQLGGSLLDALSGFYGGTTDTRTLRKDYDAERARVDRFIAHFTGGK